MEEKKIIKKEESKKIEMPKGKFIKAIGRRKTAAAQVRLYKKGKGLIIINDKKLNDFFSTDKVVVVNQPLKTTGHQRDFDITVVVKGGGSRAQAEATRHGISRALVIFEEDLKAVLKSKGWLTRDSRRKERKKPGLKKARKAPQWSKR